MTDVSKAVWSAVGRLAIWVLVILILAGAVYAAATPRYVYFAEGTAQLRKDRWTGAVEVWGCAAYQFRGTETAYFPMAPDSNADKPCTRYGWTTRK